MKKLFFFILAFAGLFLPHRVEAAVVPELWRNTPLRFETEAQMQPEIRRYANDSRMTYYLILRAYSVGTLKPAVLTYYKMMRAQPRDANLNAAFAFSHFMATGYYWDRYPKPDDELRMIESGAYGSRDRSVELSPNDPAILLMAARGRFFSNAYRFAGAIPDMKQGLAWGQKAVAKDSKWPESHFWLGKMWLYFAGNNVKATKSQQTQWNRRAFNLFQTALRLGGDPMRPSCYLEFRNYYDWSLHQYQIALRYHDAAVALLPSNHINQKQFATRRKSLLEGIAYQQKKRG